GQSSGDGHTTSDEVATLTNRLTSRSNREALIRRRGLYREITDTEAALKRMEKDLKVETKLRGSYPEVPDTITISFRHSDPQIAQQVIADLVAVIDETDGAIKKQNADEAARLKVKATEVDSQLSALSRRRAAAIRELASRREQGDPAAVRAQLLATWSAIDA